MDLTRIKGLLFDQTTVRSFQIKFSTMNINIYVFIVSGARVPSMYQKQRVSESFNSIISHSSRDNGSVEDDLNDVPR